MSTDPKKEKRKAVVKAAAAKLHQDLKRGTDSRSRPKYLVK